MSKFIEIHILQSVPACNPNRGKDGSVKSIKFGGTLRARLSSQSQKRAARQRYRDNAALRDDIALRSRHHWEALAEKLGDMENAEVAAKITLSAFNLNDGNKILPSLLDNANLLFLSDHELDLIAKVISNSELVADLAARGSAFLAEVAKAEEEDKPKLIKKIGGQVTKKELTALKKLLRTVTDAIPGEVALFGRMMAAHDETCVDGSVQVAHALGVNKLAEPRGDSGYGAGSIDFFTAVDDVDGTSGAGMMGEVRFTSTTYYRYANVNVTHFRELMGDDHDEMVSEFLKSFALSLPDGYVNQFAHQTMPSYILLQLKETSPYQLCNAFETPIDSPGDIGQPVSELARIALMQHREVLFDIYGNDVKIAVQSGVGIDSSLPFNDAIAEIMDATRE